MKILLVILLAIRLLPIAQPTALCPGAPLPRLTIGGHGEVAPSVDRLRLRALPAVGAGEERLLYQGTVFDVLAGPSCNGGYAWWRIALEDGETGWVAEGTWEAYYVRPVVDAPRTWCDSAETPWVHLLVTVACRLLK